MSHCAIKRQTGHIKFAELKYPSLCLTSRRQYAAWSLKAKKAKESVASKLKSWSEKGLLKSASQLQLPSLVATSSSSPTSPSAAVTQVPSESPSSQTIRHLTPHEIQLQEYVELCRGIIEGRPPAEALKPSKASKASKSAKNKKSKSSPIPPINQNSEEVPKLKKRGRKPKLKEENAIVVPAQPEVLPKPSIPIPAISEAPIKPKRATSTKEIPSEPIVVAAEIPTLPITESQQPPRELPQNWQHDFEQDLSPIRARMETLLHDFDHSLREESKFDQHAPLGFLPLRFWQSRFDWDEQVEKAAKKYIMSAATSKQQLDPSFKASAKDEDASVPVSFKPLQREAINIALARRNVFVALPTGGGKTMVYVLPSLLEPGITVVISPLIALIQDQVTLLESMGIGAAGISCQMSPEQLEKVYDELLSTNGPSRFKLIYVTPERIGRNERFAKILTELDKRGSLQRVVVDEAHCISEWGHDFRRDYRRLKVLKEFMPSLPIMALTGTCTTAVRKDIAEQLGIALPKKESKHRDSKVKITEGAADKANRPIPHYNLEDILEESIPAGDINGHYVLQTSFNRPNLWFQISSKSSETPMGDMLYYILNQGLAHECGIIYAMTTSDAERLADFFAQQGLLTTFYHGGMSPQARQEAHAQWARGEAKLMCTTVAFGLGIDKSNVRYVLHSTMPTSLEAYYQQAGRAGRDGNPADCVMFFDPKDRMRIEFVIKLNAHFLRQRERKAELAKQQQKLLEIQKQEIETLAKSKGLKSKRPSSSEPSTSSPAGTADSSTAASPDSDLSIVDIVDIGDSSGPGGNVRLVNEDGTEYFFEGFHPDYTGLTGVEKGEYEEEDPLDAFVRQMKTEKLDDVTSYAREKRTCRRVHLMRFFGQKFVSHQCEHSCDNCHPSARRITDKLTKRGKEEWESLAPQREARIALMKERSSRPLTPAVAKIHDLIHVQEQEMAREAEAEARKVEEEEYERQFDKGVRKRGSKRPAIPSKIGSSSPLAKKLRKGRSLSSLGDPSEYTLFEERLHEDLEAASRRRMRKPATSPDVSSSHPTPPTSDLVAPLLTPTPSTTIHESPSITRPTVDTLDSSENMQELLARIAEVTERKALRRQQNLSKKRGTSFSTKRHVIQQQDEDGYIRTRTLIPEAYGAGDSLDEFVPPPLPPPPEPVLTEPAQLSLSSQLQSNEAEEDPDDEELGEAVENARTTAEDKISSSRLNHKLLIDIRQACRRISNEKGILPQSVMSQKTMKELVKVRPKTVLQLASIKGVGPGRARRYASLLLPLFEGIDDL